MLSVEELKSNRPLLNEVDWDMTPEKAIEMYLEWGSGWTRGNDFVASASAESLYFVIFDWEEPQVTLIKRTMEGAEELAKVPVPQTLFDEAWREDGLVPGGSVHRINQNLKEYLAKTLSGPPVDLSITSH